MKNTHFKLVKNNHISYIYDAKYKINYINNYSDLLQIPFNVNIFPVYNNYWLIYSNNLFIFNLIKNIISVKTHIYLLKITINGVGYKFFLNNNYLICILGYSHLIKIKIPCSNNIKCSYSNKVIYITSKYKYILGNISFILKSIKNINVYKGTGIKNMYEQIKLKLGKIKNLKNK